MLRSLSALNSVAFEWVLNEHVLQRLSFAAVCAALLLAAV